MRSLIIVFFISIHFTWSQNPYPQDYFRSPLDVPLILSGTFGELRSNHFHAGIDIKTQQRQGLNVYTAAEGFVSRIKIAEGGYGKAIYITHPNGYVSVYAHLKSFSEKIESYVKQKQYKEESFEIELFPKAGELTVNTDEVIAYSGNTGSSAGPHLHFEIRDKQERPMNAMLFGVDIPDTIRPTVLGVFAYPIDEDSHINHKTTRLELRLTEQTDGDYKVEPITAYGKVGFGVITFDRLDEATNKNGVSNIKSFINGKRILEIDFNKFTFSETRHLNRLIDYEYYRNNRSKRIQKLFIQPNNPLSLYKDQTDQGYVFVKDSTSLIYKVRIKDFKNNEVWLTIPIEGIKTQNLADAAYVAPDNYIYADQDITLSEENVTVDIPKNTFYDDFHINFNVSSDTLKLHEPTIPAIKNFFIKFDISHYNELHKDKLYIASVSKYGRLYYAPTRREGDLLTCATKNLGTYTIDSDTIAPKITPLNFQRGKWLNKYRYLKVKIEDKETGIKSYRATINGKWILMEYDYKKKTLAYDFNDNVITESENNLKIIVTDNVGNSSTFESTFYRK